MILHSSFLFLFSLTTWANTGDIEEVIVNGTDDLLTKDNMLGSSLLKSDVIDHCMIEHSNAINFSEAIQQRPGISVNNECSMCGIKRVLMNGLRGEQTTLLIDGIPVHTLISGFYSVDAIPTTGVDHIEIARGSGASLITPEAIGGVINVVTAEAEANRTHFDLSLGQNGYQKFGLLATGITDDQKTRGTLIGQYDHRQQTDADNNGVSESPLLNNTSYIARISHDISEHDTLTMRYAHIESEIFGGPLIGKTFSDGVLNSPSQAMQRFNYGEAHTEANLLFKQGDVRNNYQGKAWKTAEWIKTERDELSASWINDQDTGSRTVFSGSYARHQQDSFYEGFDYYAVDDMYYMDARWSSPLTQAHTLTLGADCRRERLHSQSFAGEQSANYIADSFIHRDFGVYFQDTWQINDSVDLSFALRIDNIFVDFIEILGKDGELSRTIASPRFNLFFSHDENMTSRFSIGRGYRAPLSFFESDHGILDSEVGFAIDIQELEQSWSWLYTFNFIKTDWKIVSNIALTSIEHLAILTETETHIPLLTQIQDIANVLAMDITLYYQLTSQLSMNITLEKYLYNKTFKSAFSVAPVAHRLTFDIDWEISGWDLFFNAVWVGSRDLTPFGYDGYNQVNVANTINEASKKTTQAPGYCLLNAKLSKSVYKQIIGYVGVNNFLGYTQTKNADTPLMFNSDGKYDVSYIFGPLKGRELYAGIQWHF